MKIYLAKTQGFCAGVSFAIDIVDKALNTFGPPIYVYHEIVHNTYVVKEFRIKGAIFVEKISHVPQEARIIFSAHGIPPSVIEEAKARKLRFIDATCPLVTKVHNEAIRFSDYQYETILIGHKGHQELIGTAGYVKSKYLHIVEDLKDIEDLNIDSQAYVAVITQTTLSVDDTQQLIDTLKEKFPKLQAPPRSDLCYATQNRQDAVKDLAKYCDVIIICGSPNSSNSNRLRETGIKAGCESYIIDTADALDFSVLDGIQKVGISSGASVPRIIVDELVKKIKDHYPQTEIHTFKNPEKNIIFPLPEVEAVLK